MRGVQALLRDLLGGDESRAEETVEELVAAGEPAKTALLDLLHAPEADHRWWAIRVLAAFEPVRIEWFLPALEDPAPEIRAAAALAVAGHPDASAIPFLIRLLGDEDNLAALMAVNALLKIGSETLPQLLEAFEGAPRCGQIQILRTLAELRDPRAIRLMLSAQGGDSAALQYWAQQGLERLGLNMVYLSPE